MSAEAAFTRSWPVGAFTATLTVPKPRLGEVAHACIEWSPSLPSRLSGDEIAEYRAGRNRALAEISRELGINAAVLEV